MFFLKNSSKQAPSHKIWNPREKPQTNKNPHYLDFDRKGWGRSPGFICSFKYHVPYSPLPGPGPVTVGLKRWKSTPHPQVAPDQCVGADWALITHCAMWGVFSGPGEGLHRPGRNKLLLTLPWGLKGKKAGGLEAITGVHMPGKGREEESKFMDHWFHQITHLLELLTRSQTDKQKLALFPSSLLLGEMLMNSSSGQKERGRE